MTAFITLADAKAQLNISGTSSDVELQGVIDAACAAIEKQIGPVSTTSITGELVDLQGRTVFNELTTAGTRQFVLRHRPVQSITAISSAIVSGVTYQPSDFVIDAPTGIVRRRDWGTIFGPLVVDYTAGWATVPSDLLFATKELVRHLWQTQRGNMVLPDANFDTPTVVGFALPNRVLELLAPYQQIAVG